MENQTSFKSVMDTVLDSVSDAGNFPTNQRFFRILTHIVGQLILFAAESEAHNSLMIKNLLPGVGKL
jgi:hypothetical protein